MESPLRKTSDFARKKCQEAWFGWGPGKNSLACEKAAGKKRRRRMGENHPGGSWEKKRGETLAKMVTAIPHAGRNLQGCLVIRKDVA